MFFHTASYYNHLLSKFVKNITNNDFMKIPSLYGQYTLYLKEKEDAPNLRHPLFLQQISRSLLLRN